MSHSLSTQRTSSSAHNPHSTATRPIQLAHLLAQLNKAGVSPKKNKQGWAMAWMMHAHVIGHHQLQGRPTRGPGVRRRTIVTGPRPPMAPWAACLLSPTNASTEGPNHLRSTPRSCKSSGTEVASTPPHLHECAQKKARRPHSQRAMAGGTTVL